MLQALANGIEIASLVTILAGALVLAGAIANGHRARLYDAVVLKVLGATRGNSRLSMLPNTACWACSPGLQRC